MDENDFESIMSDVDPLVLSLAHNAETFKKAVDSTAEIFSHSVGIGLPEELATELALVYMSMIAGGPEGE